MGPPAEVQQAARAFVQAVWRLQAAATAAAAAAGREPDMGAEVAAANAAVSAYDAIGAAVKTGIPALFEELMSNG